METQNASIISKISIKSIGAKPLEAVKQEKKVTLAAIYGRGAETKVVNNVNDGTTSTALIGAFEAVNLISGEVFRSGKLYLPNVVQGMVVAEVKRQESEGGSGVDFAFEISAVPSSKSGVGYEYQVRSLLQPTVADPLEQMRQKVMSSVKLLEAPKDEKKATAKK